MSWALLSPLLFFVAFMGMWLLYTNMVRAQLAMCARETARDFGIAYHDLEYKHPGWKNRADVPYLKERLNEEIFNGNAVITNTGPCNWEAVSAANPDKKVEVSLMPNRDWITCKLSYEVKNFFPFLPRLLGDSDASWWKKTIPVSAVGSAKIEYGRK